MPLKSKLRSIGWNLPVGVQLSVIYAVLLAGVLTLLGFTLGSTIGIAAGVAIAQSRTVRAALEPLIYALWAVPKLALLPLLLLVFGIGETPMIILIAITQNGLNLLGISPYAFKMIIGAIILLAITLSSEGAGRLIGSWRSPAERRTV